MAQSDTHSQLVGLFVATARAHHAATGGVNPQWAQWYAEHLVDDVNRVLGTEMSDVEVAEWLTDSDRRYRETEQEESWPKAYATWLLEGSD